MFYMEMRGELLVPMEDYIGMEVMGIGTMHKVEGIKSEETISYQPILLETQTTLVLRDSLTPMNRNN